VYLPFRRLGAEFHATADGIAVAERMLGLIDAPASAVPGGSRLAPNPARAPIRFEDVSFSYPARAGLVLDGLDLELEPGEVVALVGESGAGKSTVAALLLGLIAPTGGRITIGGIPLESCHIDEWRRQVAWLPQHPALLRGTVADNIWLGDPGASYQAVVEAAAMAGAEEFIAGLPNGFRTVIGDGSLSLSAGERRRIGLARAFLKNAPLVILDEPTADLDPLSVAIVSHAIRRLAGERTMLVIAHRPELVQHVDRVVCLLEGAAYPEREWSAA
jgi:ABC-type multidrug transport system fused ATPase/permease subunit